MRLLLLSVTLSLASLPAFVAPERADHGGAPRPQAPWVHCERPRTLHLRRFEDRSAQLRCAGRILVRVSVPG